MEASGDPRRPPEASGILCVRARFEQSKLTHIKKASGVSYLCVAVRFHVLLFISMLGVVMFTLYDSNFFFFSMSATSML